VPTTVRCAGSDARSTTAAGVSALRPFAMSVSMSEAKRRSPMKKTIVCVAVASRDQSCVSWLFCGDSVAVTYARLLELSRWVSDSPAYAAAASGVEDIDAHAFMASKAGAQLAAADPHGLDADEVGALWLYTAESDFYPTLNRLLRTRDRSALKPFFPYLQLMLTARSKLPKYTGSVWRGVKGVDLRAQYPKDKEVWWWAFSSTTKQLQTLTNPMFLGTSGVRTVFMIEIVHGVDLQRYSAFQGVASEAEVLLYPGTKLKVVDAMEMGGGLFQVHLREVPLTVAVFK
jgi:hypothetical protein